MIITASRACYTRKVEAARADTYLLRVFSELYRPVNAVCRQVRVVSLNGSSFHRDDDWNFDFFLKKFNCLNDHVETTSLFSYSCKYYLWTNKMCRLIFCLYFFFAKNNWVQNNYFSLSFFFLLFNFNFEKTKIKPFKTKTYEFLRDRNV